MSEKLLKNFLPFCYPKILMFENIFNLKLKSLNSNVKYSFYFIHKILKPKMTIILFCFHLTWFLPLRVAPPPQFIGHATPLCMLIYKHVTGTGVCSMFIPHSNKCACVS